MILPLVLAAIPCVYWDQGTEAAKRLEAAGVRRVCVPPQQAEAWRGLGFTAVPVGAAELADRARLPAPGIRARPERASATRSPWIDASGWRFQREPQGRFVYEVRGEAAPLAAAEAFAYGADTLLRIAPQDVEPVGRMLEFLSRLPGDELPEVADLAVVDDGSPLLAEVMNLLVRRNLLFRVVHKPSPAFPVNVELGTSEFPRAAAADPSAFAIRVRRRLTDERRSLRIFGSEGVIARLTADGPRARLHLLNYSGRELEGLRIRVRGSYSAGEALVAGHQPLPLEERSESEGATEFSLTVLTAYGVVDLSSAR